MYITNFKFLGGDRSEEIEGKGRGQHGTGEGRRGEGRE